MLLAVLALAAFFTALISGVTGLGGGTILQAILFVALAPALAVPVHAAVQLASNGTRAAVFGRKLHPWILLPFLAAAIPSALLASRLVRQVDPSAWRLLMGVFVLLVTWTNGLTLLRLRGLAGMLAAGLIAGGLGMFVGATGALIAPFFLRDDWSKEEIIGNEALCQGGAHLVKIAIFSRGLSFDFAAQAGLIVPMAIAVAAGAWTGKHLVSRIPEATFRLVFRLVLTALALHLLWEGARGLVTRLG